MPALDAIANEKIARIAANNRVRRTVDTIRAAQGAAHRGDQNLVSFSCNDYLGLSQHAEVKQAAQDAIAAYGTGAGASRMITGNNPLYTVLESALAAHHSQQDACVFGSGYLANIGVIPALVGTKDLVIADKLVHASILDGIQLSGAKLRRFSHNNAEDCSRLLETYRSQYRHCLVITETIFSMDGDCAPLNSLRKLCNKHDAWLMTDSAHSIGQKLTVSPDVTIGTLSKTLGAYGGYVCASRAVIEYIKTSARSLIFTTALPPAILASAIKALEIIAHEPDLCEKPLLYAQHFTKTLSLPLAESAIVPLLMPDEMATLKAAQILENKGFLVGAIRPPTVPINGCRLRFTFNAMHKKNDITNLIESIKDECISS
ncbi:MAG: 8-amino-7-oxononanoate synthase [Alphaproteobacteria bacterium]|nr:8-amino-7-oxononanoate synthase [Alphaproteobacteria bacterium]